MTTRARHRRERRHVVLGTRPAGWRGQPDARDEHDEPLQVDAMGDTIQEALDACADACDEAESL